MIAKPADPTIPSIPSMILALMSTKGSNQSPGESSARAVIGVSKASGAKGPSGLSTLSLRVCTWRASAGAGTKRGMERQEKAKAMAIASGKAREARSHAFLGMRLQRAIERRHSAAWVLEMRASGVRMFCEGQVRSQQRQTSTPQSAYTYTLRKNEI